MSAEVLGRAAALMRERAEAATPGPWISDQPADSWRTWDGNVETHHPDLDECDNTIAKTLGNDDAQHVASWHPAVALAVADWLEEQAGAVDMGEDDNWLPQTAALAVARAYLGPEAHDPPGPHPRPAAVGGLGDGGGAGDVGCARLPDLGARDADVNAKDREALLLLASDAAWRQFVRMPTSNPGDLTRHAIKAIEPTVEAIVARVVNEALTEAADAIDEHRFAAGRRPHWAARTVRARIT